MAIKGYWKLNGNSNDYSGNGNNGTDYSIDYVGGALNLAALFNSSSDRILINGSIIGNNTSNRTISCMIKANSIQSQERWIFCGSSNTGKDGKFVIETYGNAVVVTAQYTESPWVYSQIGIGNIVVGKWHHIVGTLNINQGRARVYLDGKMAETSFLYPNLYASANTNANSAIGNYAITSNNYAHTGIIDEMKYDNTEWSPAQVKNEYARTKGFF